MEPLPTDRSIALIGLPAAGKTVTAACLARLLGLPALDLDEVIAEDAGADIPSIFAAEGEEGFRERESLALRRASEKGPHILAAGGGIVLRAENRALLRRRYLTVWLQVSPDTAAARAEGGSRPLLANVDAEARIRELDAERSPLYAECADIRLDADGLEPSEAAEAIRDKMG